MLAENTFIIKKKKKKKTGSIVTSVYRAGNTIIQEHHPAEVTVEPYVFKIQRLQISCLRYD